MNFSSLSLLRGSQNNNKQFAVIGLGRFGRAVCATLHNLGYEVLGTDINEKRVSQAVIDQITAHAVQLDSTEPSALKEAGIFEFDTVIVAIGNYLQESIITTLNVKEAGVPHVVAKASSEVHCKLLRRVGADRVVYPENEAGCALARALTKPSILDRFEVDTENSIVEVLVPADFNGKTIAEIGLRSRYGLNLLAVCYNSKFLVNPEPDVRLWKDSLMVLIGANRNIDRLPV
ncbi:MAG TPA: TrkA family potassium uptake protein [Candidatus Caenarcaniphilales bacterium]